MHRCYLPDESYAPGKPLRIRGEEVRHALRVLRMQVGDDCEVFDGVGHAAQGKVQGTARGELTLEVERVLPPLPHTAGIVLAVAVPKGALMELIVQKAVEMGVSRIIPLVTTRTIVRLSPDEAGNKRRKWSRTALEACKQCGVNSIPTVEIPHSFADFLRRTDELPPLRLHCALVSHARPLREVLETGRAAGQKEAVVLVGPEGDFTPEENAAAAEAGFSPVSLGPIVLRVESAVFFAVSAVRYALDPYLTAGHGLSGDH